MPPATPAPALRRRRPLYRRILWWGVITAAILFVLFAIVWVSYSAWTHRQLARERQLIADAGEPLNWAAFRERYPDLTSGKTGTLPREGGHRLSGGLLSEYLGAAPYYAAAIGLLPAFAESANSMADQIMVVIKGEQRTMTAVEAEWIGEWLAERRPLFDMLDKATSTKRCALQQPQLRRDETPLIMAPQVFGSIYPLSRVLAVRARWQAHRGELDAAVDSIIGMLRLNRMMVHQPRLMKRFFQAINEQSAIAEAQHLMSQQPMTKAALRRLAEELRTIDDGERFRRMLIAERIWAFGEVEAERRDKWVREWFFGDDDERLIILPPLRRHFQAAMLGEMRVMIEATKRPYAEQVAMFSKLELDISNVEERAYVEYRTLSMTRAMYGAIAVELYRIDHDGRVPPSWEPLVTARLLEAPPLDPFTGDAMKLLVTEASYTIYSLGENGMEDGGAVASRRGRPFDEGLVFQIVPRE